MPPPKTIVTYSPESDSQQIAIAFTPGDARREDLGVALTSLRD
jgi:hypothetical protein